MCIVIDIYRRGKNFPGSISQCVCAAYARAAVFVCDLLRGSALKEGRGNSDINGNVLCARGEKAQTRVK